VAVETETSAPQTAETVPAKATGAPVTDVAVAETAAAPKKTTRKRVKKTITDKKTDADAAPVEKAKTEEKPKKARKPAVRKKASTKAALEVAAAASDSAKAKASTTPKKTRSRVKKAVRPLVAARPAVATTIARPVGKVAVAVTARTTAPVTRRRVKTVDYQVDELTGRPILPERYQPSADEEYMNPLHQEYFRQQLQKWRADLVEESRMTIENLRDEVRDIGDEAERATRETENSLELRTRDRYRKLIAKIDSTLKRLDEGDYGYCIDTGEEIGLGRLEVRLTAERTVDAQERWEHLQRQHGD